MKKFTTQEIRDLLNQVYHEEISFSRMVEILNEMVSEAEKKCVEDIPKRKFKNGDKVRIKDGISSRTVQGNHPSFQPSMDGFIGITMTVSGYTDECGYVVCEEAGWRFHEDWLEPYTDDIPKPKFKVGDKVRIKEGVSSKTVHGQDPVFQPSMDDFIGTIMTVNRYHDMYGYVICNESDWKFNEDWLEPYTDELKKGDLAIFWDLDKWEAFVGKYNGLLGNGSSFPHQDHRGNRWANAIKFESVEQFNRFIKGEI